MAKVQIGEGPDSKIVEIGDESYTPTQQDVESVASSLGIGGGTSETSFAQPQFGGSQSTSSGATMDSQPQEALTPGLNMGDYFNKGIIRGAQYEKKYFEQLQASKGLWKGAQVSVTDDGRIQIGDTFVDPKDRNGWKNWTIDNIHRLSEFLGEAGLPIAGQVGADVAAASSGVGLAGLAGANAAGAAGGEAMKQAYAKQLVGEPPSLEDVGIQAAVGAASVPIAKAATKVLGSALTKIQKNFPSLFGPVTDSLGLNSGNAISGEYLGEQLAKGRKASEILDMKSPEVLHNTINDLLLGNASAKGSPEGIFNRLHSLLRTLPDGSAENKAVRDFYQNMLGISEGAIDYAAVGDKSVLQKGLTSPSAWINFAEEKIADITRHERRLLKLHGQAMERLARQKPNVAINFREELTNLGKELDARTIFNGSEANPLAPKEVVGAYQKVFEAFEKAGLEESGTASQKQALEISQAMAKKYGRSEIRMSDLLKPGDTPMPKNLSLARTVRLMKELDNVLDSAFNKVGPKYSAPLADFVNNIRTKVYAAEGSRSIAKGLSEKIATFKSAKQFLGELGGRANFDAIKSEARIFGGKVAASNAPIVSSTDSQINLVRKLSGILGKGNASKSSEEVALESLDRLLPKNSRILPGLKRLVNAEEWQALNYDAMEKTLADNLRSIHPHNSTVKIEGPMQLLEKLKLYDQAFSASRLPGASNFLQNVRDHLTATSFTSNKTNIFKARIYAGLLGSSIGLGFTYTGHPIAGALALGGAAATFSPGGMSRTLRTVEGVSEKAAGVGKAIAAPFQNQGVSSTSRALLNQLVAMGMRRRES